MQRKLLRAAAALALATCLTTPLAVLAHGEIHAGDYVIEFGWVQEPVTAGIANGIELTITGQEAGHHEFSGSLSLAAPADGSTIQGDQMDVTIAVEGVEEHEIESLHWHIYVDERVLTMAPLSQTTVTVKGLSNGAHTVKAAIAGADHAEVGNSASVVVTVEGSSATGDPTVETVEPMAEAHGHAGGLELDISGLKGELVYGGETYPLTFREGGEQGHFVADFTPERPGQYMLQLSGSLKGSLGEAEVSAEVEPEEVTPGASGESSPTAQSAGLSTTAIVVIAALGLLLAGALAAGVVISRRRK